TIYRFFHGVIAELSICLDHYHQYLVGPRWATREDRGGSVMLRRMRVALGFVLMTIGALGTVVGTARASQRAGARSDRPLADRSDSRPISRRLPSSRPSRVDGAREQERPIWGGDGPQTAGGPGIRGQGGLRAAVESRMQQLVAEQLGVDLGQLAPEVSLTDDLAADSLDLLELALVLESEFTITLPQRRIGQIRTYRDLVDA